MSPFAFASGGKSSEFLESCYLKIMVIVLHFVSSILSDEGVEGPLEIILALIICKVVSFEIVQKDIVLNICDASELSTIVLGSSRPKYLTSRMRDYFSSSSLSLFGSISLHVIALYPESKVSLTFNHLIINVLILRIRFHVGKVWSDFTKTYHQYHV